MEGNAGAARLPLDQQQTHLREALTDFGCLVEDLGGIMTVLFPAGTEADVANICALIGPDVQVHLNPKKVLNIPDVMKDWAKGRGGTPDGAVPFPALLPSGDDSFEIPHFPNHTPQVIEERDVTQGSPTAEDGEPGGATAGNGGPGGDDGNGRS